MLEKFQEISKVILIPAVVLYFLGFISISAYLARFGIVTFDIVNARFIVAGIFPLISVFVSFVAAYTWHKNVPTRQMFFPTLTREGDWRARYRFLGSFCFWMISLSIGITFFFNIEDYNTRQFGLPFLFHPPYWAWDFVGMGVQLAGIPANELGYLLRVALFIFGYATVIYGIIWGLIWFVRLLDIVARFARRRPAVAQSLSNETAGTTKVAATVADADRASPTNRFTRQLLITADFLVMSIFLACMLWSTEKVRASVVTFRNVSVGLHLDPDIYLAWMVSTTIVTYFLLGIVVARPRKIQGNMFSGFGLGSLSQAFQSFATPLMFALFTFGGAIFPRIPFAVGGGQPREVRIVANGTFNPYEGKTFLLLGESNQFLFVVDKAQGETTALQINKDTISRIETTPIKQ